jgi:hypothetical protein
MTFIAKMHHHRFGLLLSALALSLTFLAWQQARGQAALAQDAPHAPLSFYVPLMKVEHYSIPAYINQVDPVKLEDLVYDLTALYGPRHPSYSRIYTDESCSLGSRVYNRNNLLRALDYVQVELETAGYSVFQESVPGENGAYNLIAERTGRVYPTIIIEIGAHIDSVAQSPGASDNASGIAAVVEIARVLADFPNRYTWRFIAFINEEYGLKGSRHHADQVARLDEPFKTALILDGIGWSETAPLQMNCIWDNGDPETQRIAGLFDQARSEYQIDIGWRRCSPTNNQVSDNIAYWEQGLPAVLSIGGLPYIDPEYHQCNDTLAHTDLLNVLKTTQENLAVLLTLDLEDATKYPPVRFSAQVFTQGTGH